MHTFEVTFPLSQKGVFVIQVLDGKGAIEQRVLVKL
jgi:hypothetical protein